MSECQSGQAHHKRSSLCGKLAVILVLMVVVKLTNGDFWIHIDRRYCTAGDKLSSAASSQLSLSLCWENLIYLLWFHSLILLYSSIVVSDIVSIWYHQANETFYYYLRRTDHYSFSCFDEMMQWIVSIIISDLLTFLMEQNCQCITLKCKIIYNILVFFQLNCRENVI